MCTAVADKEDTRHDLHTPLRCFSQYTILPAASRETEPKISGDREFQMMTKEPPAKLLKSSANFVSSA